MVGLFGLPPLYKRMVHEKDVALEISEFLDIPLVKIVKGLDLIPRVGYPQVKARVPDTEDVLYDPRKEIEETQEQEPEPPGGETYSERTF